MIEKNDFNYDYEKNDFQRRMIFNKE